MKVERRRVRNECGCRELTSREEGERSNERWVGNALTRRKGVGVFGSALLRCEGVRGFGFGIGCSGVIQTTRDGRRQVGIGPIGVGTVTVVIVFPRHSRSLFVICFSFLMSSPHIHMYILYWLILLISMDLFCGV